ncbi:MAG: hypothetical protein L3J33_03295 [Rhodobacteraceae bacterium]|nr:hypothetical protein [Paracoccaceae bacterium]
MAEIDGTKFFEKQVTDTVTGFTGTCIGLCQYTTGSDQYLIAPRIGSDRLYRDSHWFDVGRVVLVVENEI